MKVQVKKVEENRWEIEINDQEVLDFLVLAFEKISSLEKKEIEQIRDEMINKVLDRFLLGSRGENEW